MTPVRRRVLELILLSDQPIRGICAERERKRGRLGPPTVYRALDFLLAQKLIHKVETSNAFVALSDVEHSLMSQFVICEDCGATEEIRDEEIAESLRRLGEGRRFCRRTAGGRGAGAVSILPQRGATGGASRPGFRPL
jgi:Fur family zinc uptake transcriptional regulator